MPTNRTSRRRRGRLTIDQYFSLTVGAGGVYRHAFASDAERRQAWTQHRDEVLANFRFGMRPSAWWEYEAPIGRPADHSFDAATLYAMNMLPPAERKQVEDLWKARFEEAFETEDFTHSLGPDEFLHGAAARRAHFNMHGILPALVDQWEAERKVHPPAA